MGTEGFWIALAGLVLGGGTVGAVIGWIRYRKKDKVEVEAQKQATLSNVFDDASDLNKYVQDRIDLAIAPLQQQITDLKQESHSIHDAVRTFFSELWAWDFRGRKGPMPFFPEMLLTKLRLEHLLIHPAAPQETEGTNHE